MEIYRKIVFLKKVLFICLAILLLHGCGSSENKNPNLKEDNNGENGSGGGDGGSGGGDGGNENGGSGNENGGSGGGDGGDSSQYFMSLGFDGQTFKGFDVDIANTPLSSVSESSEKCSYLKNANSPLCIKNGQTIVIKIGEKVLAKILFKPSTCSNVNCSVELTDHMSFANGDKTKNTYAREMLKKEFTYFLTSYYLSEAKNITDSIDLKEVPLLAAGMVSIHEVLKTDLPSSGSDNTIKNKILAKLKVVVTAGYANNENKRDKILKNLDIALNINPSLSVKLNAVLAELGSENDQIVLFPEIIKRSNPWDYMSGYMSNGNVVLKFKTDPVAHGCNPFTVTNGCVDMTKEYDFYFSEEPFLLSHSNPSHRKPNNLNKKQSLRKFTRHVFDWSALTHFFQDTATYYLKTYRIHGLEAGKTYFVNAVPYGSNINDNSLIGSNKVFASKLFFKTHPEKLSVKLIGKGTLYGKSYNENTHQYKNKLYNSVTCENLTDSEKTCEFAFNQIPLVFDATADDGYQIDKAAELLKFDFLKMENRLLANPIVQTAPNTVEIIFSKKHDLPNQITLKIPGTGKILRKKDGSVLCESSDVSGKTCSVDTSSYDSWWNDQLVFKESGTFKINESGSLWNNCSENPQKACSIYAITNNSSDVSVNLTRVAKNFNLDFTGKGTLRLDEGGNILCNNTSETTLTCSISLTEEDGWLDRFLVADGTSDFASPLFENSCSSKDYKNRCKIRHLNMNSASVRTQKIPNSLTVKVQPLFGPITLYKTISETNPLTSESTLTTTLVCTVSVETDCSMDISGDAEKNAFKENRVYVHTNRHLGIPFTEYAINNDAQDTTVSNYNKLMNPQSTWKNCEGDKGRCYLRNGMRDYSKTIEFRDSYEYAGNYLKGVCENNNLPLIEKTQSERRDINSEFNYKKNSICDSFFGWRGKATYTAFLGDNSSDYRKLSLFEWAKYRKQLKRWKETSDKTTKYPISFIGNTISPLRISDEGNLEPSTNYTVSKITLIRSSFDGSAETVNQGIALKCPKGIVYKLKPVTVCSAAYVLDKTR